MSISSFGTAVCSWLWPGLKPLIVPVACLAALLLSGCAVLDDDHWILTRACDARLAPSTDTGEAVLAPLAVPMGFTTLAIDGFLINPVSFLPESADNAKEVFTRIDSTGLWEIWVFPMRVATYPIIFVGSEIAYCTLPIF